MDSGTIANWAGVISLWIAIVAFWSEKRRERREREYGTYHALDEKYADYLTLCAARPELDLYFVAHPRPPVLDDGQALAQLAHFEILVSLFERAFLMYQDHPNRVRAAQWAGWERCLRAWVQRPLFGELWRRIGPSQFDREFVAYMAQTHGLKEEAGAALP